MFGEDEYTTKLTEELLETFTLEEILELNDLTEHEVVAILIRGGHIGAPEHLIELFEGSSTEEDA